MKKELVRDIREKIQFLVAVEIFFSTLIYSFFRYVGSTENISNEQVAAWAVGVAATALVYLLIPILSKELFLKIVAGLVSVGIVCFIISIFIVAMILGKNSLPISLEWPFKISLYGSLWIPLIILGSLPIFFFSERVSDSTEG